MVVSSLKEALAGFWPSGRVLQPLVTDLLRSHTVTCSELHEALGQAHCFGDEALGSFYAGTLKFAEFLTVHLAVCFLMR